MKYKNCLFLLFIASASTEIAFAQQESTLASGFASNSWGVNRRVLTNAASSGAVASQYCGVRGNFTFPRIFVPSGPILNPGVIPPNRADSKPTFYLGARRNGFEVDAGLQYEWRAMTYGNNQIANPGYSVFVRISNPDFTTGGTVNPLGAWRCGPGTSNNSVSSFDLQWLFQRTTITSYKGYLKISANGAVEQPRGVNDAPGIVSAANGANIRQNIIGMRMKKVVGITQGTPSSPNYPVNHEFPLSSGNGYYSEDGSYMYSFFSGGELATNAISPAWFPWDSAAGGTGDIDLSQTGISPGAQVLDKTFTQPTAIRSTSAVVALPVFQFVDNSLAPIPSTTAIPSRYRSEGTAISLRRAIPVYGELIAPSANVDAIN